MLQHEIRSLQHRLSAQNTENNRVNVETSVRGRHDTVTCCHMKVSFTSLLIKSNLLKNSLIFSEPVALIKANYLICHYIYFSFY